MRERHPFIKKGSSEGSEMAARREIENEWFGDHRVEDILLGEDALFLDRELHEPLVENPLIDQADLRMSLEKRRRQRLDAVRRHLHTVADRMPREVDKMFRHYFEGQPDVEAATRRIGLEYVGDEVIEAETDWRWKWFQQVDQTLGLSKDKIRRRLIAEEAADVLTQRFEHGPVDEKDDIVSDEILLEILADRKAWVETRKRRIQERLDHVAQRVHERLLDAAKDGTLPVDPRVVEERLSALIVDVLDPLAYRLDDVYGEFNSEHHAVHLSAAVPYESEQVQGMLELVYTHEVMHAISGQQELFVWTGLLEDMDDETDEDDEFERANVMTRVGLRLSSGLRRDQLLYGEQRRQHLRWLNEAVTEQLSQRISGLQEKQVYKPQRELLQRLIDAGLPEDIVTRAYFENDTRKKPGHRMPAMKELFDQTNTLFGRGFLLGLDALIRDQVRKSDVRGIRAEDAAITELLREWDEDQASVIARAVERGNLKGPP